MKHVKGLKSGFADITCSRFKLLGLFIFSLLIFFLSITLPYYDFVLNIVANYGYNSPQLLRDLAANLYLTGGLTAVILTIIYSVLSAGLVVNLMTIIAQKGLRSSSYGASILPGFIAGGCAACGASIIPILGLGASSILFPLGGNLWRIIAIITIIYAISILNKESKTCKI